jgi:hypothetical protein
MSSATSWLHSHIYAQRQFPKGFMQRHRLASQYAIRQPELFPLRFTVARPTTVLRLEDATIEHV